MTMQKSAWAKNVVEWFGPGMDTVNLSVVFSWQTQQAYMAACWWKAQGYRVRVGGPGIFVRKKDLLEVAEVGGDFPDAVRYHNPSATFASKGCTVGCYFCIVPAMEGREFTLLPDFEPRPILCDNNLSGLPADYQDYIVDRYRAFGVPLLDAQSGFEPKTFDGDVLERWAQINQGPWRYAFDETEEADDVQRVCAMLKDYPSSRKRVYVLIGNEPFQACMDRITQVVEWGAEPHVQPMIKLNAPQKRPWVKFDWTEQKLRDVARWANRWIWRKVPFEDYKP